MWGWGGFLKPFHQNFGHFPVGKLGREGVMQFFSTSILTRFIRWQLEDDV